VFDGAGAALTVLVRDRGEVNQTPAATPIVISAVRPFEQARARQ